MRIATAWVGQIWGGSFLPSAQATGGYAAYNVASGDYITVTEIARLAVNCAGLDPGQVEFEYTGGSRGWKGDVPIVRLNTSRIRALGWECHAGSCEALRKSMVSMLPDLQNGRL